MAISFPIPTAPNEQFSSGGKTWQWNGYAWDSVANASALGATGATGVGATGATGPLPADAIVGNSSDPSYVEAIRTLTSTEYDALGSPDSNTIYFIL
jgi:hypothetical protein